jgi:murein L,D-transpeptidase YafK
MKLFQFKTFALLLLFLVIASFNLSAQSDVNNLRNSQLSFTRVAQAYAKYNDTLKQLFTSLALSYPPKDIYIREFKSQNELELWGRDGANDPYKLIKLYRV